MRLGLGSYTPPSDYILSLISPPASSGLKSLPGGGSYNFTNGISNDPILPPYLQSLTPGQLDCALNNPNCDPTPSLINSFTADIATDTSFLRGCNGDPNCGMSQPTATDWGSIALLAVGVMGLIAVAVTVKR